MKKSNKPLEERIKESSMRAAIKKGEQRFKDKKEGENYVVCHFCKMKSPNLGLHLSKIHLISNDDYKNKFNLPIMSSDYLNGLSEKIKGSKNPAYQHGGKFSPFSDKFIYADRTDIKKLCEKSSKSNRENGNNNTTIKYWLKQGFTKEEALEKISERQSTFSLEKCISKYGLEQGTERWKERQEKWQSNFRKNNFSKVSQELFWILNKKIPNKKDVMFATKGRKDKNNEYILSLDNKVVRPDFIDLKNKKIIEFDGTYWHGKQQNPEREKNRDISIKNAGYTILHIKEEDYYKQPKKVIQECLSFLKQ